MGWSGVGKKTEDELRTPRQRTNNCTGTLCRRRRHCEMVVSRDYKKLNCRTETVRRAMLRFIEYFAESLKVIETGTS